MASGIIVSASAVSTKSQNIFDDISEWFENDFVDFWEEDFVGAFEDLGEWFETDFVDFWEEDFVDTLYYVGTFGHNEDYIEFLGAAEDGFEDIADWFSGDFVEFWEEDFVEFWKEDFVEFWEDDFVNFWKDLPELMNLAGDVWHGEEVFD